MVLLGLLRQPAYLSAELLLKAQRDPQKSLAIYFIGKPPYHAPLIINDDNAPRHSVVTPNL